MVSPLNYKVSRLSILVGILVFIPVFYFLSFVFASGLDSLYMRVLVLQNRDSLGIQINGAYAVYDKNIAIHKSKNLNSVVLVGNNKIRLGNINFDSDSIMVKAFDSNIIKINDREFKGDIRIALDQVNKKLLVINFIELDEYIKGVLYHEVSHHWPIEALKSQAIISRTFALYQRKINKDKNYDVTADVYSQVYGGKTSERYRTNQAVDETRGQIVVYKNKIFPTYFSATCAGQTEDASRLWQIDIEPLKGVKCAFCQDSPHFKWRTRLSLKEIKGFLSQIDHRVNKDITNISVVSRNQSQRIESIEVSFDDESIVMSGKDFRGAIGPNIIRSTNFKVEINHEYAYFEGLGWGHGVGLCQWGAYFMAKQGYKYDQIIGCYFPQSKITTISKFEY